MKNWLNIPWSVLYSVHSISAFPLFLLRVVVKVFLYLAQWANALPNGTAERVWTTAYRTPLRQANSVRNSLPSSLEYLLPCLGPIFGLSAGSMGAPIFDRGSVFALVLSREWYGRFFGLWLCRDLYDFTYKRKTTVH